MKQKVYEADCIEHGERFYALFKTKETNPLKLKMMGQELASDWGAECIAVNKATNIDGKYDGKTIEEIWDCDAEC